MIERVKANITFISLNVLILWQHTRIRSESRNDKTQHIERNMMMSSCVFPSTIPKQQQPIFEREKTHQYIAIPCRVRWERRLMPISIIIMFVAYILWSLIILTTVNVQFSVKHFYSSLDLCKFSDSFDIRLKRFKNISRIDVEISFGQQHIINIFYKSAGRSLSLVKHMNSSICPPASRMNFS